MPNNVERFAIRTDLSAGWDCYTDADGRLTKSATAQERRDKNRKKRQQLDRMTARLDAGKNFRSRTDPRWRGFRQACLDLYNATHGDGVTQQGITQACVRLDATVDTADLALIDP